jgi:hypothetical protein
MSAPQVPAHQQAALLQAAHSESRTTWLQWLLLLHRSDLPTQGRGCKGQQPLDWGGVAGRPLWEAQAAPPISLSPPPKAAFQIKFDRAKRNWESGVRKLFPHTTLRSETLL